MGQSSPEIINVESEDLPDITLEEMKAALDDMKNNKSLGEDGISIEAIKFGGDTLLQTITTLFNQCLQWEAIPKAWEKLENYRPISLLSTLYKLFMRIIAKSPNVITNSPQLVSVHKFYRF